MRKPRKTRLFDWIQSSIYLLCCVFFLVIAEYGRLHGITPKSELIVTTGAATEATVSHVTSRYGQAPDYLHFTVNNYTVDYESDRYGYDTLLAAVRNGTPLTIGVSTKRETLIPLRGRVPLYSLSIGPDVLLTYEDAVAKAYRPFNAPYIYIVVGVFMLRAAWGLYTCFKNRNVVELLCPEVSK